MRSEKKRVQNPLFWKVPNRDYRKGIDECPDLGGVGREAGVQGDHLLPVLGVLGHPHAHHHPTKEGNVQDLIFLKLLRTVGNVDNLFVKGWQSCVCFCLLGLQGHLQLD